MMETDLGKSIPFKGLAVLSAVCRYKNFTVASQALHVTPSAVSKQIAQLEAQLGVILFDRRSGGLEPSKAALSLAGVFDEASGTIAAALAEVRPRSPGKLLRVAAPASFAMRWLIPRLWDHARHHPDVNVDVIPTHANTPLAAHDYDVAIRQVQDPARMGDCVHLISERLGFLVHPSLLRRGKDGCARDLPRIALIESESRPGELDAWAARLSGQVRLSRERRRYPHFYIALEAALAGQGGLVGPLTTLSDMIRLGQLVEPFPRVRAPGGTIVAFAANRRRPVGAQGDFIAWLATQVGPQPAVAHAC